VTIFDVLKCPIKDDYDVHDLARLPDGIFAAWRKRIHDIESKRERIMPKASRAALLRKILNEHDGTVYQTEVQPKSTDDQC
jgi:hypothetical protein